MQGTSSEKGGLVKPIDVQVMSNSETGQITITSLCDCEEYDKN